MKLGFIAVAFAGVILASCASAPKSETSAGTMPAAAKTVERETIDYKGSVTNQPIPEWVNYAIDGDKAAIAKTGDFDCKILFIADRQGKNQNALKSWVNNVDIKGGMSKALSDFVIAKFGGEAQGSPDEKESWDSFMKEMTSTFSKVEINGMIREKDYWIEQRIHDKVAKTTEDIYTYFVLYSIDKEVFKNQLDEALGLVEAKNEKQAEAKTRVEAGILEAQVFGESK